MYTVLTHKLPWRVTVAIVGLLALPARAADWDMSEDAFDAAQGGVQIKGWLASREDQDVALGGYACRGCQRPFPFVYLYLPQGHEGEDTYPMVVNGRTIMVQEESGDTPGVVTDQVPINDSDADWLAQQVIHDRPITLSIGRQVWHFANRDGHRFVR